MNLEFHAGGRNSLILHSFSGMTVLQGRKFSRATLAVNGQNSEGHGRVTKYRPSRGGEQDSSLPSTSP